MMSMREQLLATALKFLEVQSSWDFNQMETLRTPTCCSTIMAPSRKVYKTSDKMESTLDENKQIFKKMTLRLLEESDTVIDESAKKVAMRVRGQAETTVGPYVNDWVFILTMTEDGKLVSDIKHIFDTVILAELETRVQHSSQSYIPWISHLTKEDVQGTALQEACS